MPVALSALTLSLAALVGVCVGSFLNVVIARVPDPVRTPWSPRRSLCPGCSIPIAAYDNIPLLSYVLLRGRCRHCRMRISPAYPLVEMAVAAMAVGAVVASGVTIAAAQLTLFGCLLLAIAITDARTMRIPAIYTDGGMVVMLLLTGVVAGWLAAGRAALEALALGGVLFLFGRAMSWLLRRPALGSGDVAVVALLATVLGFSGGAAAVFLGAVIGSALHGSRWVYYRVSGDTRDVGIFPFAPLLAVGAVVVTIVREVPSVFPVAFLLPWH